jgi:hypothetical protein
MNYLSKVVGVLLPPLGILLSGVAYLTQEIELSESLLSSSFIGLTIYFFLFL